MSYYFTGVVGHKPIMDRLCVGHSTLKPVCLYKSVWTIPLPEETIMKEFPSEEMVDGFTYLTKSLCDHLALISEGFSTAYCEAEYLGGEGNKSILIFENGLVSREILSDHDAFNEVIRHFKIESTSKQDEFDIVQWGRHRETEEWFSEIET